MGRRNRRNRPCGTWRFAQSRRRQAKRLASIAFCGVLGLLLSLWVLYSPGTPEEPEDSANSWLPLYPVGGMPINFAHTLTTNDGPVFFCREHCIEKFQAEPSRYATEVAGQRKHLSELPSVQLTCPASRGAVDPDVFTEFEGRRVLFCSEGCRQSFVSNPEGYCRRITGTLWYQTRCPITGNPIDPSMFSVLRTGERVHFCSEACKGTFLRDPSVWSPSLASQSVRLHAGSSPKRHAGC